MINEAFTFMIFGMGVVFLFLVIMVLSIKLQAYLINLFFVKKKKINKKTVSAIVGAITHHTQQKVN